MAEKAPQTVQPSEQALAEANPIAPPPTTDHPVLEASAIKEAVVTTPRADSNDSEGDVVNTMALLPRNTVVRIAGNNRTKAALIGLQATVRRSIGLGGWHWLVLPSGEEIKLQRNALTVLEYPTGQEAESSASEGERHKPVTPLSGPDVRDGHLAKDTGPHAMHLPAKRPRPLTPTAAELADGRRISLRQQQQHQVATTLPGFEPHVNLGKLQNATLRRYLTLYDLSSPGSSRDDMLDAAQRHFDTVEVTEDVVVRRFLEAAKRHGAGATAL